MPRCVARGSGMLWAFAASVMTAGHVFGVVALLCGQFMS
jgi:hypothetical protein